MRSESEFQALLDWLDADREQAGERYEQARRKLIKIFQWRGCDQPEEYADLSLDRVARRVAEGETANIKEPWVYIHGVALNVLREYWRSPARKGVSLEQIPLDDLPAPQSSIQETESQLACLDRCLANLPGETRSLVLRYHQGKGGQKIQVRKTLAQNLGISLGALRIRLCRLRGNLEQCMNGCLESSYEDRK